MKSWQVWVGMLVVLLSGVVIGILGSAVYFKHQILKNVQGGPPAMRKVVVGVLDRQLDFTDVQREQVTAIIAEAQKEMIQIRASMQPRIEALFEKTMNEIHPILTPEQSTQLNTLHDTFTAQWAVTLTNSINRSDMP